jgi:hypothetical protein
MSAIFLSHSSKDKAVTAELKEHLEGQGHRSIFLDFDPEDGIPAGRDWEQELYQRLRECQAVIVLCSESSMSSRWCFAEITHAKSLGKHIFPIKVTHCEIDPVLTSHQVLDLLKDKDDALQRLWLGLKLAGLDPAKTFDWDGSRPPYPGLLAFQEDDAAIFFGRDPEIQRGLEELRRLRRFGGSRVMMVLGASGSGKSSLVQAGLLPRLRRNEQEWLVVDPFRPQEHPLRELAIVLEKAFAKHNQNRNWKEILRVLEQAAEAETPDSHVFGDLLLDIQVAAGQRQATVLLIIDQTEELFSYSDSKRAGCFLSILRAALEVSGNSLMAICTLRSDFLGDFQQHPAARDLAFEDLKVGPMTVDRLVRVIEGPARLAGIELETGLTEEMIKDTETEDALPLLAFTLRELYERYGDDKLLEVEEYRNKLGGLGGAVARAADSVFAAESLSEEQHTDLRKAFIAMVRINEEGQFVRRPVRWADLPKSVHGILERFVQARLLIIRGEKGERMLEVAHEALFRSWDRIKGWLDEDREFLLWQQRLRGAVANWVHTDRDQGTLLRGAPLAEADGHLKRHKSDLTQNEQAFVEQSVALRERERETKERARQERERLQKRSNRRLRIFLTVALGLAAVAVWQLFEARIAEQKRISATIKFAWQSLEDPATEKPCEDTRLAGAGMGDTAGIQGLRGLYCYVESILGFPQVQQFSGLEIFIQGGPHNNSQPNFKANTFGYYNKDFVIWARENLIPTATEGPFKETIKRVYNKFLQKMARAYYVSYQYVNNHPEELKRVKTEYLRLVERYKGEPWQGIGTDPGLYIQYKAFQPFMKEMEKRGYEIYSISVAPGFWVRRSVDGTAEEIFKGLEKLMRTYDAQFLDTFNDAIARGEYPIG